MSEQANRDLPDDGHLKYIRTAGIRNVLLPSHEVSNVATTSGVNNVSDLVVQFDPHMPDSISMRLGDIDPARVQAISDQVKIPKNLANDKESEQLARLQYKGAAVLSQLRREQSQAAQQLPAEQLTAEQLTAEQLTAEQLPAEQLTRSTMSQGYPSPSSHIAPSPIRPRPVVSFHTQLARVASPARPVPEAPAPEPLSGLISAHIQIQGFQALECFFADVIIQDDLGFLVLVHDTRNKGIQKYFPEIPEEGQAIPLFGFWVTDHDTVFFVQPSGIQFAHGHCEYCVLQITRSAPRYGVEDA